MISPCYNLRATAILENWIDLTLAPKWFFSFKRLVGNWGYPVAGAMKNKIAPATLNLNKIDHIYDIDLVPKNPKDHNIDIVMSNSFGFGGTNTALLFKNI